MADRYDELIEYLGTSDPNGLKDTVAKLGQLGDSRAVPLLIDAFDKTYGDFQRRWVRSGE